MAYKTSSIEVATGATLNSVTFDDCKSKSMSFEEKRDIFQCETFFNYSLQIESYGADFTESNLNLKLALSKLKESISILESSLK